MRKLNVSSEELLDSRYVESQGEPCQIELLKIVPTELKASVA
jgi:hypothetical protein